MNLYYGKWIFTCKNIVFDILSPTCLLLVTCIYMYLWRSLRNVIKIWYRSCLSTHVYRLVILGIEFAFIFGNHQKINCRLCNLLLVITLHTRRRQTSVPVHISLITIWRTCAESYFDPFWKTLSGVKDATPYATKKSRAFISMT